jgi:hypothetical protein
VGHILHITGMAWHGRAGARAQRAHRIDDAEIKSIHNSQFTTPGTVLLLCIIYTYSTNTIRYLVSPGISPGFIKLEVAPKPKSANKTDKKCVNVHMGEGVGKGGALCWR